MLTQEYKINDVKNSFYIRAIAYSNINIIENRKLIGSMCPKNVCFNRKGYRTLQLNTILEFILLINSKLKRKEKGERYTNLYLSPLVARRGIEPLFPE